MYIIKNALRCIGRSKGRNILIGIIALVIAVSACLGLSIRQAAVSAKENALSGMSITATIAYDRSGAMNNIMGGRPQGGGFDKDQFAGMMGNASSLTLEEYETYAKAESVGNFYYTLTAYWNGTEGFEPVTDETSEDSGSSDSTTNNGSSSNAFIGSMGGMMGGFMGGGSFSGGDFTLIGYSSDAAMTDFKSGISSITSGAVFEEGTTAYTCIISEELATYNSLSVGDTITISNIQSEEETYQLTVVGIYSSTTSNDFSMSMFGASQDPANRILMSAPALQTILDASAAVSIEVEDSYGRTTETKTTGTLDATYVFADLEHYYAFEDEARALGLSENYTISSTDVSSFENSLTPLNTLGDMAGVFLVVILAIGGIILVVLNIFNVRERKYEIGVLTAMGMKKWKVACQFVCEILVVTMVAVLLGACIGAVSSVPVTNALLESQVTSQSNQQSQMEESFGRPGNMGGFPGGMGDMGGQMPDMPGGSGGGFGGFGNMGIPGGDFMDEIIGGATDYVTEIDSAMNLTVVFQMLGIGLLLTLVAGMVSVLFVMRYDPLKILSNRD